MIVTSFKSIDDNYSLIYADPPYMYKGRLIPVNKDERGKIHTVFRERTKRHSQKPQIAYEIIERLYPNLRKLEMYARNTRDGWDSWGREVK